MICSVLDKRPNSASDFCWGSPNLEQQASTSADMSYVGVHNVYNDHESEVFRFRQEIVSFSFNLERNETKERKCFFSSTIFYSQNGKQNGKSHFFNRFVSFRTEWNEITENGLPFAPLQICGCLVFFS